MGAVGSLARSCSYRGRERDVPEPRLTEHELRMLRGMMDEYEFARQRKLLATQRWRSNRVWGLYLLAFTLYSVQLAIALYAVSHP